VGVTPIKSVESPIIKIIRVKAGLRPLRSAYIPSNTPPNGRTTNEMANVAVASTVATKASSAGKNARVMKVRKNP